MNRLTAELQRLYGHPAASPADLSPGIQAMPGAGPDGSVRALLVDFRQSADWPQVAALHAALQTELELPAPAISVDAKSGYRLWLSLAAPVPLDEARRFLEALRARYLGELPAARIALRPGSAAERIEAVPASDEGSGKWSAFIDPGLGEMFAAEAGLDMAPNMARQADMLAGLASIDAAAFRRALANLTAATPAEGGGPAAPAASGAGDSPPAPDFRPGANANANANAGSGSGSVSGSGSGSGFDDPKRFLFAVMNDPAASLRDRIEAAKALLPFCGREGPESPARD